MNKPLLNAQVFRGRKVVDVDTHLVEPHDLWTKRAPAKYRDRVPQVRVVDGVRSWVIDGDKILSKGAIPAATVKLDGSKWPGLECWPDTVGTRRRNAQPTTGATAPPESYGACGLAAYRQQHERTHRSRASRSRVVGSGTNWRVYPGGARGRPAEWDDRG